MCTKNNLFKTIGVFVLTVILLFSGTSLAAEITRDRLKSLVAVKDEIRNNAGYKISFVMVQNANLFDPNQGIVFMDCQATFTKEGFAMKITYHYEHPPVFARVGTKDYEHPDYDEDGNLIVWRPLEKHILFAHDRSETIKKIKSFFVAPNGKLVDKGGIQTILTRFPPGDRAYTYEFNQFQLASGRGLSRHLSTITSIETLSSGLIKATSKNLNSSDPVGTWELTVDPNSDYLVRAATFILAWKDKPTKVITSSGVIAKDGLKLAKYGTYRYSNLLEVSVEVADISKVVGPNKLYDEVFSRVNSPLPPGSDITDFRGGKLVVTTVE